jgi:hypothetical protein
MYRLCLYTELVQAQPVGAAMSLHHAKLVESLLARRGPATNVPLLCPHGLMEALRRAVRTPPASLRSAWDGEGFRCG